MHGVGAKLIADASGYSIIGGGDTVAAIEELGLNEQFGFVTAHCIPNLIHPFSLHFALGDPKIPGKPMGKVYKM